MINSTEIMKAIGAVSEKCNDIAQRLNEYTNGLRSASKSETSENADCLVELAELIAENNDCIMELAEIISQEDTNG